MREKLMRFMHGRYGMDQFGRFLMYLSIGIWVVSLLFMSELFYLCAALLIYANFRVLSRNTFKRASENRLYLSYASKVKQFWREKTAVFSRSQTHRIFKCPACRQKIRVPKGRGRIEITCPKCRETFIKTT